MQRCVCPRHGGGGSNCVLSTPIDTEGREAVTATERGWESWKGGSWEPVPAIFSQAPFAAPAPGCVSSTPHFTPFLGNIHKSQDSRPSLPEHFPGDQVSGGAGGWHVSQCSGEGGTQASHSSLHWAASQSIVEIMMKQFCIFCVWQQSITSNLVNSLKKQIDIFALHCFLENYRSFIQQF